MQREAAATNERHGWLDAAAADYANLGLVLKARGDVQAAEAMSKRSLEMSTSAGERETQARAYASLGNIEAEREHLERCSGSARKGFAAGAGPWISQKGWLAYIATSLS
ncbi:MAG: hypothetical protein M3Z32_05895 [Acidobacteriota bacterium]|nr:hypothetical protein [Acidobacteriota bacterium]